MPAFESKPSSAKPKGIPTVVLAIGGAFLGMLVAVGIFFGSGMADSKPVVTKLREPEVPKDTPAAKAKLNARKTEQAASKFESSLKDAFVAGNIATATRLATTKEPGMTNAFLNLCRLYSNDSKATTRAAVASALGAHLADKPGEDLEFLKLMDDKDKRVVLACLESLENIKPCPAAFVRKAFSVASNENSSPEIRERLASWIRNLTPLPPSLVTVFALEADTKIGELRPMVAEALAKARLEPKNGLELAWKFISDPDPKVASAGIRMVAQYGKDNRAEALVALIKALDSKEEDVRASATTEIVSFGKIGLSDLPALMKSLGQGGDGSRVKACALVGGLGADAKPALSSLVPLARPSSAPELATAAISAMGMMGKAAESEIGVVREATTSQHASVRVSALVALAKISRDPKSFTALIEAVGDTDPLVSKAASVGIDSINPLPGSAEDLKVLESMLAGKPAPVRAKVFSIASRMGADAKALVPQAVRALDDPDTAVMVQAGLALMAHPDRQAPTLAKMQSALFMALPNPAKESVALAVLDFLAQAGPKAAPAVPTLRRALGPDQRTASVLTATIKASGALGKDGIQLIPDLLNHVGEPVNPPTDTIENFTDAFLKARHNQSVVDAIAAMGPTAVPEMEKLLARPQIGARFFALLVFEKMGQGAKDALPSIGKLAVANGDPSPLVNGTAVRVRAKIEAESRK